MRRKDFNFSEKFATIPNNIAGSSNGRTTDSGSVNLGSSPSPAARVTARIRKDRAFSGKLYMSKKLFEKLRRLKLPRGEYAIFGSAPLCVRGLREVGDLDVIVTEGLFDEYKQNPDWTFKEFKRGDRIVTMLEFNSEKIELYKNWGPGEWDIRQLIKESEIIDDLPFVKVAYVIEWKRISGREKDLRDIEQFEKLSKNN